jgi:YfiH family protein
MKLHILSDLHLGQGALTLPRTDADLVVLAGDIARPPEAVAWASQLGKPVLYVLGNHEFYGGSIASTAARFKALSARTNVRLLDDESVVIGNVRFLGSTLWTDFLLFGEGEQREAAIADAVRYMRDYSRIGIGDDPKAVAVNQARLAQAIGVTPVYLNQVHGIRVVRLTIADATPSAGLNEADGCVTTQPGLACTAQVADCLPVLFAAPGAVGAAHAGWRGLSAGVLEATLAALCEAARCKPSQVHAWLGACIGPDRFEVGADVLKAFGAATDGSDPARFRPHTSAAKWLANLPRLARDRLEAIGVASISGGDWCTVEDASRFFSFRRDGVTGRMVAAVWLRR